MTTTSNIRIHDPNTTPGIIDRFDRHTIRNIDKLLGTSISEKDWRDIANTHLEKADKHMREPIIRKTPDLKFHYASSSYLDAAEAFRICSFWHDASNAYEKTADLRKRLGHYKQSATCYTQAAEMMERVNPALARKRYSKAVTMLCEAKKFGLAGRLQHKKVAAQLESDGKMNEAIDEYKFASDYYRAENLTDQSNACLIKSGQLKALLGDVDGAILSFSEVDFNFKLNHSAKIIRQKVFFLTGLTYLSGGSTYYPKLISKLELFKDTDPCFESSQEYKFLKNICKSLISQNIHMFADHLHYYDIAAKIDFWTFQILQKIVNIFDKVAIDNIEK